MNEYNNLGYDKYNYNNNYNNNYQDNSEITTTDSMKPFIGMFFLLFLSICLSCLPSSRDNTTDLRINLISNDLPIIVIKNINQDICSICLENFIINDQVNKLSCNHIFHKKCLDSWIHNNNCPLCRKIII
jgi:hypothetical protein